jgi:hypothetical protein
MEKISSWDDILTQPELMNYLNNEKVKFTDPNNGTFLQNDDTLKTLEIAKRISKKKDKNSLDYEILRRASLKTNFTQIPIAYVSPFIRRSIALRLVFSKECISVRLIGIAQKDEPVYTTKSGIYLSYSQKYDKFKQPSFDYNIHFFIVPDNSYIVTESIIYKLQIDELTPSRIPWFGKIEEYCLKFIE